MAFVQSATDSYGNTYPIAYWKVTSFSPNTVNKTVNILFQAWKDETSRNADLQPIPGLSKYYGVTPPDYATYFAPEVIQPQGIDHIKQCYTYALATDDFFAIATNA